MCYGTLPNLGIAVEVIARSAGRSQFQCVKLRIAILALVLASPAAAQRSLHWSNLQVDATLQSDGTLHVTERQTMVFTGDWNGGERRFDVRPRQRFEFEGMVRFDSTGSHGMRRGDLANVDGFDFTDPRTLRWRSRLPSDPPFDNTAITYQLAYSLSGILVPEGDGLVLNHDFAFADRAGLIENVQVRLKLDAAWQPSAAFAGTWQGTNLPPGEGFVVRVPLRYIGAGDGPDVSVGAEPIERAILATVLLMLLGSIGKRLYAREKSTGRLDPLPTPDVVSEKWLEENVFAHLPEVVGAAWDNRTECIRGVRSPGTNGCRWPDAQRGQTWRLVQGSRALPRAARRPESLPRL